MKTLQKSFLLVICLILTMSLVACAKKEASKETLSTSQDVKKMDSGENAVGVIVSIEVPQALGDHLEMAINYETIEANMIKSSPVWKDYLFHIGT